MRNKLICCLLLVLTCGVPVLLVAQQYDAITLQQFYKNQDYEQAIKYLENTQTTNDVLSFQADMGYSHYMAENYAAAKKHFNTAYREHPRHVQANIYLASIFTLQKKYDSALLHYKNLTHIKPRHYGYWQSAANTFSRMEEYDSAYSYIATAYTLNPGNANVLLQYVSALKRKKSFQAAEQLVDEFLKKNSNSTSVIAEKIGLRFSEKDNKAVIYWGEKMVAAKKLERPTALIQLAYSYLYENRVDESLHIYHWLLEENMASESLMYCASLCYASQKKYTESNALLDDCLKLNIIPDAVTYFRAKADNFIAVGKFMQAVKILDSCYYMFHNKYDLYLAGYVYDTKVKDKAKATSYYKKYLANTSLPGNVDENAIAKYIRAYIGRKD